jgi:hypothetical protein
MRVDDLSADRNPAVIMAVVRLQLAKGDELLLLGRRHDGALCVLCDEAISVRAWQAFRSRIDDRMKDGASPRSYGCDVKGALYLFRHTPLPAPLFNRVHGPWCRQSFEPRGGLHFPALLQPTTSSSWGPVHSTQFVHVTGPSSESVLSTAWLH